MSKPPFSAERIRFYMDQGFFRSFGELFDRICEGEQLLDNWSGNPCKWEETHEGARKAFAEACVDV